MKPKALAISIAITLFAVLAVPARLTAQEEPGKQQQKREHHRYRFVDLGTFGGPASYINHTKPFVPWTGLTWRQRS